MLSKTTTHLPILPRTIRALTAKGFAPTPPGSKSLWSDALFKTMQNPLNTAPRTNPDETLGRIPILRNMLQREPVQSSIGGLPTTEGVVGTMGNKLGTECFPLRALNEKEFAQLLDKYQNEQNNANPVSTGTRDKCFNAVKEIYRAFAEPKKMEEMEALVAIGVPKSGEAEINEWVEVAQRTIGQVELLNQGLNNGDLIPNVNRIIVSPPLNFQTILGTHLILSAIAQGCKATLLVDQNFGMVAYQLTLDALKILKQHQLGDFLDIVVLQNNNQKRELMREGAIQRLVAIGSSGTCEQISKDSIAASSQRLHFCAGSASNINILGITPTTPLDSISKDIQRDILVGVEGGQCTAVKEIHAPNMNQQQLFSFAKSIDSAMTPHKSISNAIEQAIVDRNFFATSDSTPIPVNAKKLPIIYENHYTFFDSNKKNVSEDETFMIRGVGLANMDKPLPKCLSIAVSGFESLRKNIQEGLSFAPEGKPAVVTITDMTHDNPKGSASTVFAAPQRNADEIDWLTGTSKDQKIPREPFHEGAPSERWVNGKRVLAFLHAPVVIPNAVNTTSPSTQSLKALVTDQKISEEVSTLANLLNIDAIKNPEGLGYLQIVENTRNNNSNPKLGLTDSGPNVIGAYADNNTTMYIPEVCPRTGIPIDTVDIAASLLWMNASNKPAQLMVHKNHSALIPAIEEFLGIKVVLGDLNENITTASMPTIKLINGVRVSAFGEHQYIPPEHSSHLEFFHLKVNVQTDPHGAMDILRAEMINSIRKGAFYSTPGFLNSLSESSNG